MTTATALSPLVEIEYRTTWLEQNPGAPRAVRSEELEAIGAAVERARTEFETARLVTATRSFAERRGIESPMASAPVLTLIRGGGSDG